MLTPKEVQEITFVKAVFGGYDMKTVDDFLDTLSEDYITLYNENASLKSKLRVLVAKIEEYRGKENALNQAQVQAAAMAADAERKATRQPEDLAEFQAKGEEIIKEANAKQEQILAKARQQADELIAQAKQKVEALEAQAVSVQERAQALASEEQRVENARRVAQNFITAVEEAVGKHLNLLEDIRKLNPVPVNRPYDYESEADHGNVIAEPEEPVASSVSDEEIDEIARNVEAYFKDEVPAESAESNQEGNSSRAVPDRFADLQFGPGYDPMA